MRSPKKKPFSKSRKHSQFKITNWHDYNNFLRKRGRIDFMIAADLCEGWYEETPRYKKRGGQKKYSDIAILRCFEIRYLFNQRLRQTQGFIDFLFESCNMKLTCPDYTSLSKRGQQLCIELKVPSKETCFDYVVIDSTGIQTFTGNEWLENKHGKTYSRRIWKKLHITVDDQDNIIANSTTCHNKDDRSQILPLLKSITTKEVFMDCGYDGENIYALLKNKGVKPTIRPPNLKTNTREYGVTKTKRHEAVNYQYKKGYHAWRVKNNYGRREKVENTFFRFKTSFGSQFLSRNEQNMKNEMTIKCQLLNRMFEIGRPISVRVN